MVDWGWWLALGCLLVVVGFVYPLTKEFSTSSMALAFGMMMLGFVCMGVGIYIDESNKHYACSNYYHEPTGNTFQACADTQDKRDDAAGEWVERVEATIAPTPTFIVVN
jgi:hypothetical protein